MEIHFPGQGKRSVGYAAGQRAVAAAHAAKIIGALSIGKRAPEKLERALRNRSLIDNSVPAVVLTVLPPKHFLPGI
ncbi:MAG: hypothetical protein GX945_14465 [Lentisphaerae bacterium]|nr:hypothetical protein [Lentisphaerota bacterium]